MYVLASVRAKQMSTFRPTPAAAVCCPERPPLSFAYVRTHTLIPDLHKIACKICRHRSHTGTHIFRREEAKLGRGVMGLYKQEGKGGQADRMRPITSSFLDYFTLCIKWSSTGSNSQPWTFTEGTSKPGTALRRSVQLRT